MNQGFTFKRCACTDPRTGKPYTARQYVADPGTRRRKLVPGTGCPKLDDRHHGSWFWSIVLETSQGAKKVKRGGFAKQGDAAAALGTVNELAALAADDRTRAQVGDMIVKATLRGGQLPAVKDVKRRLGLGAAPGEAGVTFGEAWPAFVSGNKRLRQGPRERLVQIGEHWLLPVLGDVALERLNGVHCAEVFDRIDAISAEITRQRGDGRAWAHVPGDVRERPKLVGNATQHRVFAALRSFCNYEVRVTRRMDFNPVYAVRLAPEVRPPGQRWSPEQAGRFLASSAGDPLHLLFRIVLLCGARRGEACGFRRAGSDLDAAYLAVERTILLIDASVVEGTPKTSDSERRIWLDAETARLLREHRRAQLAARLRAGSAWADNDLVFAREDGTPYRPDYVLRRLKRLAADADLPVIKLHEGRHTYVICTASDPVRDVGSAA